MVSHLAARSGGIQSSANLTRICSYNELELCLVRLGLLCISHESFWVMVVLRLVGNR